jgi:hypothetical protein
MKHSVHSWARTLKDARDLGARGLWDCVEGSWREWNHARKYPTIGLSSVKETLDFTFWQEEISAVIFFLFIFISTTYIIKLCAKFFLSFRAIFCCINPYYRLIRMTSSSINPDLRGFTVLLTKHVLNTCSNVLTLTRQHMQYRRSICLEVLVAFWWRPSLAETCKGSTIKKKHCSIWWNSILTLLK